MKSAARQAAFYTLIFAIWFVIARLRIWPPYLFPPPQGVLEALWSGFADHSFAGEMIFVSLGLGQLLMMGRDLNDMSQVIAVMILIIAIGYIIDGLVFSSIEQRLQYKWGLTPTT
jgi:NitT/TauT family transport system permease protein